MNNFQKYIFKLFGRLLILPLAVILLSCETDGPEPFVNVESFFEIFTPATVTLFDIGNQNNASDIRVEFVAGPKRLDVAEYRIFIAPSRDADSFTLENALSNTNFDSYSSFTTLNRFNLSEELKDINGNNIANGEEYAGFVLVIPKNENSSPKLSTKTEGLNLRNQELRDIYITSRDDDSVILFDGETGEYLTTIIPKQTGFLREPQDIIYQEEKNEFLLCGYANTNIKRFDSRTGEWLGNLTDAVEHTFKEISKINIGPDGFLYASEWADVNAILKFDLETGAFIGEVIDPYLKVSDFAWDSNNNVYVVGSSYTDISQNTFVEFRKYDSDFNSIARVRYPSVSRQPINVWLDENDILYVLDRTLGSVEKYDSDLNFIEVLIDTDSELEGFLIDGDELYLCDKTNRKVNLYNRLTGDFIRTFIDSQKIPNATSMSFGPDVRPE